MDRGKQMCVTGAKTHRNILHPRVCTIMGAYPSLLPPLLLPPATKLHQSEERGAMGDILLHLRTVAVEEAGTGTRARGEGQRRNRRPFPNCAVLVLS